MIDRLLSELSHHRARRTFAAARAFVVLVAASAGATAGETPTDVKSGPPASAPADATSAPAPALPTPAQPKPATDDHADDAQAAKPSRAPADSDANSAAPQPAALPDALVTPAPTRPRAPEQPDIDQIDDGKLGTHQEHWLFGIGLRETFVTGKGYDPFSTDNVLPQVSLDLGRAFYASGPLSIAGMLAWDYGSTKAVARGADASLGVNRLTVGAEARYHLLRRLYVFGRIAPGALHSAATLHDQVLGIDRESDAWVFTSDFSLGTAFEFAGDARGASTRPRGWIGADGGYSWSQTAKLDFKAVGVDSSTPARLDPLRFDELAVRGAFLRLTATLTY